MSFLAFPDKSAVINTFVATLLFCLPLAGTEELFAFMVIGQLLFICMVFFCYRKEQFSVLGALKNQHPATFFIFIGWLIAMAISFSIVFTTPTNGWQKAAAITRQLFILVQIAYCVSLMRFLTLTNHSYERLMLAFGMGFISMAFLHFAVLYWGPYCESDTWLKNPFLSPNMRDIGDLATAAIAIFSVMYCFSKQSLQAYTLLLLLTLSWAYLLWSGGRTAIISSFAVNVLTLLICRVYGKLPFGKIAMSMVAIAAGYFICAELSIYEWNGLVRYSSEWQQNSSEFKGDVTSGRMEMWLWSIKVFLQKPWFGLGPYSFYFLPDRFAHQFWHDHPHNLVIQCLIEWGITGTLLCLGCLLAISLIGIKHIRQSATSADSGFLASSGIVMVLTLGSLTGGSYWDYQPVMILVTAFACFPFLAGLQTNRSESKNRV